MHTRLGTIPTPMTINQINQSLLIDIPLSLVVVFPALPRALQYNHHVAP